MICTPSSGCLFACADNVVIGGTGLPKNECSGPDWTVRSLVLPDDAMGRNGHRSDSRAVGADDARQLNRRHRRAQAAECSDEDRDAVSLFDWNTNVDGIAGP